MLVKSDRLLESLNGRYEIHCVRSLEFYLCGRFQSSPAYGCKCCLLMVKQSLQDSPFQGEEAKRQKPSKSPNVVSFRLLCPGARTGSIIGKVVAQRLPTEAAPDHICLQQQLLHREVRLFGSSESKQVPESK